MDSKNLCTYGYKSMLECVTRATLLEQPNDNLEFVIQYFSEMKDFRESQQETDPKVVSFLYQEQREKTFFRNRITTNEVTATSSDVSSQTEIVGEESNRKETEKTPERRFEVPGSSLDVKVESKLAQSPCDVSVKTSHVYSISDPKEQERKETTEISVNLQISVAVKSSKSDDVIASGSGLTSPSSNLPNVTVSEVTHRVTTLPTASKDIEGGQVSVVQERPQPVKQREASQTRVQIQRESSSTERTITAETEIITTGPPETEQVPVFPGESTKSEDITSLGASVTRASLKFCVTVPEVTDRSLLPPTPQKEKQDDQVSTGQDPAATANYRAKSPMSFQVPGMETTRLQSTPSESKPLIEIIVESSKRGGGTSSEPRIALPIPLKSPETERMETLPQTTPPPFETQTRQTPLDMLPYSQFVRESSQADVVTTSGLSLTSTQPADRLVLSPPLPKRASSRTQAVSKPKTPQPGTRSPRLESAIRSPPLEPEIWSTALETDTIPISPDRFSLQPTLTEYPKLEEVAEFSSPSMSFKPSEVVSEVIDNTVLSPSSPQEPQGAQVSASQMRFLPSKLRDLLPVTRKVSDSEKTRTPERETSQSPLEPVMSPPILKPDTTPISWEPETTPKPVDTKTRMIQLGQSPVPLIVMESSKVQDGAASDSSGRSSSLKSPMVTVPEVSDKLVFLTDRLREEQDKSGGVTFGQEKSRSEVALEGSDTKRATMLELDTRRTPVDQSSVPPIVRDSSELEVSSLESTATTTLPNIPCVGALDKIFLPPFSPKEKPDVSVGRDMIMPPKPREGSSMTFKTFGPKTIKSPEPEIRTSAMEPATPSDKSRGPSPMTVKPFSPEGIITPESDIRASSFETEIRPISLEQFPVPPISVEDNRIIPFSQTKEAKDGQVSVGQDTALPTKFRRGSPVMVETSTQERIKTLQETRVTSLEGQLSVPTFAVDSSKLEEFAALESRVLSPSLTPPCVIVPVVTDNIDLSTSPASEIIDTQISVGQAEIVPSISEPSGIESAKSPEPETTSKRAVSETWPTPLDLFPGPSILVDSSKLEESRASGSAVPSAYSETTPIVESIAPESNVTCESIQLPILTAPERRDDFRDVPPPTPPMEKQDDQISIGQSVAVSTTTKSREASPMRVQSQEGTKTPETVVKPIPIDISTVKPISVDLKLEEVTVLGSIQTSVSSDVPSAPIKERQVDQVAVDEDMTLSPKPRGASPEMFDSSGPERTEKTETQIIEIPLDQFSLPPVPVEPVGLEEDTISESTVTSKSQIVPSVTASEFTDSLPPTEPKEYQDDQESGRQDNLLSSKLSEEQTGVFQASETDTKSVALDPESRAAPLEPETRPAPLPPEKAKTIPTGSKAQKAASASASTAEKATKPGTKTRPTLKKAKTTPIQASGPEKTKTPGPASKSGQVAPKTKTKPSGPVPPTTIQSSKVEEGTASGSNVIVQEVTENQGGQIPTEQDKPAPTKTSEESPMICETERTEVPVPEIRPLESEKRPSPPEKTKGRLMDSKAKGSPKVRSGLTAASSSAPEKTKQTVALKPGKKVKITAAPTPKTGTETRQDAEAKETDKTSGVEPGKNETTLPLDIKAEGKPPSMKTRRVTTLRDQKKQDGKGISDNGKFPKTPQKSAAFPSDTVPEVTPRLVLPPIPSKEIQIALIRDKMLAAKLREDSVAGELESLTRAVPMDECLIPLFPFSNMEDITELVSGSTSLIPPGAPPDLAYNLILPPIKSKEYQNGRMAFGQDRVPEKLREGSMVVPEKSRVKPPGFRALGPLKVRPLQASDLQKTKTLGPLIWSKPAEPKSPWDHCNRLPEMKRVLWTDRERVNPVVPRMRRGIQPMHSSSEPTSDIVERNISNSI